MHRTILITTTLLAGLLMAACDRAPAGEPKSSAAAPATTAPTSSAPSPAPSGGPAPSVAATTPSPSDGSDPAFKAAETTKAGSAIGGTQGGNVTDPQGTTPKGAPVAPTANPAPTGGDGTTQGDKGATAGKATPK